MTVRFPMYFETEASWTAGRTGKVAAGTNPVIVVGPPPEFGGPEEVWSPEQLLVGAINSCFMLTFLDLAQKANLEFRSFTSAAAGQLDLDADHKLHLANIILNPNLVIAANADLETAHRLLLKAKSGCLISNTVKATVKIDPEVTYE